MKGKSAAPGAQKRGGRKPGGKRAVKRSTQRIVVHENQLQVQFEAQVMKLVATAKKPSYDVGLAWEASPVARVNVASGGMRGLLSPRVHSMEQPQVSCSKPLSNALTHA